MLRELLKKYPNAFTLSVRIKNVADYEGLTDDEYILREAEWVVEDYEEDTGHLLHDKLLWAKDVLKKTKNGKQYKMSILTLDYTGYTPYDFVTASHYVDELKETKAFIKEAKKWLSQNQKLSG